jgi:hypothetical protein
VFEKTSVKTKAAKLESDQYWPWAETMSMYSETEVEGAGRKKLRGKRSQREKAEKSRDS